MRRVGWIVSLLLFMSSAVAIAEEPAEEPTQKADPIAGTWILVTTFGGRNMESRLVITREADGGLSGVYHNSGGRGESAADGIAFTKDKLLFTRTTQGRKVKFEATITGNRLVGLHHLGAREIPVVGARGEREAAALRQEQKKANERSSDLEADYEKHSMRAAPRDAFPVLFDPKLTPAAEDESILDDELVVGIAVGEEAKAYPIAIMGKHELANDTCGGIPIAASW